MLFRSGLKGGELLQLGRFGCTHWLSSFGLMRVSVVVDTLSSGAVDDAVVGRLTMSPQPPQCVQHSCGPNTLVAPHPGQSTEKALLVLMAAPRWSYVRNGTGGRVAASTARWCSDMGGPASRRTGCIGG